MIKYHVVTKKSWEFNDSEKFLRDNVIKKRKKERKNTRLQYELYVNFVKRGQTNFKEIHEI